MFGRVIFLEEYFIKRRVINGSSSYSRYLFRRAVCTGDFIRWDKRRVILNGMFEYVVRRSGVFLLFLFFVVVSGFFVRIGWGSRRVSFLLEVELSLGI